MKVSVIITTYKRPHYLKEAIESVLAQNFKDFELIIVNDDPSGKETEAIVLSYNDPRIQYIKNEKNLGGSKSLNIGLNNAKGDYIAVLDDDDVWLSKDKLAKQVKFLEENPEYIIVGTSSVYVDEKNGKEISRYTGQLGVANIENFLLARVPFAHSSILCRKNAMLTIGGYSEDLPRAKDIDLYLKIFKLGKFGFLPECFIKHREASLKDKNDKEIIKNRCLDSFFHTKIIWRHRKNFPHFGRSYLKIILRYLIFKILTVFPFFYRIYKMMRYNKEYFLPTLKIPSVNRFSLNRALFPLFNKLKKNGVLLEVGYSPDENYKKLIPHAKYLTLDIEAQNNPDICCDVCDIKWSSNYFDAVIAIEVLEHVYSPEKAINEIWRILKPGGSCVLSTRFLHFYHPGPKDYYRFTWDSLSHLFRNFRKVEIYHHGNEIQCIWHIITSGKAKVVLNVLNPLIARINFKKTKFPLGFVIYAEK